MSHPSMHKHAVPCDCGCGVVLITTFEPWGTEPEEVYVEFFESFQGGNLRMRLRAAWRVVRGKDPWLHAAVFQDEGLARMREAFGGDRPVLPPYNPDRSLIGYIEQGQRGAEEIRRSGRAWAQPDLEEEVRGLARDLTATRMDLSDTLRENAELEQFVRLCATGKRPDGTYNLGREALEQRARELLEEMGGQP